MSNTQEAYIQTLKQIKDAEESAEKEVEAQKREVEEEIRNLQTRMEKKIEAAKIEGREPRRAAESPASGAQAGRSHR